MYLLERLLKLLQSACFKSVLKCVKKYESVLPLGTVNGFLFNYLLQY